MYPLPAVLVNCPDSVSADLRAALNENGVSVLMEFPNVDAVLTTPSLAREGGKRLFVTRIRSLEETTALSRLDMAFAGCPILALVEGDYDANSLFRVSRAGASQLLPLPLIKGDLAAALDRVLIQYGLQSSSSRVIAIGGVTEGAGATTLAVELAAEIAALGAPSCVLTELPRGVGRLAGLLNVEPSVTSGDVLGEHGGPTLRTVQSALTPVMPRLSVLVAPYNSLATHRPTPVAIAQFVRALRQAANFTIIDLPSTFDAECLDLLGLVDEVVLVARQEVPSVQAARLVVGGLRERGLPDPRLLLNMYESERESFSAERISKLLDLLHVFPVRADPAGVRTAANLGEPLMAVQPKSPALRDLRPVAVEILHSAGVPIHQDRATLWGWIRNKFGSGSK